MRNDTLAIRSEDYHRSQDDACLDEGWQPANRSSEVNEPPTARQLAEKAAQKLWQWVERENVTGPLDPADIIEAAILDGRKELEAQLERTKQALDITACASVRAMRDMVARLASVTVERDWLQCRMDEIS